MDLANKASYFFGEKKSDRWNFSVYAVNHGIWLNPALFSSGEWLSMAKAEWKIIFKLESEYKTRSFYTPSC